MITHPRRRSEKLLVRELKDEFLVYDLDRHRAHCLNRTAALVFQLADGERTVAAIAAELATQLGVDESEPLVELALRELAQARLLAAPEKPGRAISRREILQHLKVAAVLLPVVATIVAPTAVSAASQLTQAQCILVDHTKGKCAGDVLRCTDVPGTRCRKVGASCRCV